MPEVEIRPAQRVAYQLQGPDDGPALLLITGLGGLKEGWFRQVPAFADTYRVIAPDNRGMGGSTSVPAAATLRDFAEDLVLVLDHLEVERVAVWGVSMGGKIAQELALGWPDRVTALVLENTSAGESARVEGPRPSPLKRSQGADAQVWLDEIVPLLFGRRYREENPGSMRAFARSRERNPSDPEALRVQWDAYEAFDSWERLSDISAPTLCLAGAEDALCDPENSRRMAARIPGAEVAVLDDLGHSMHIEDGPRVNAVVRAFLERHVS